MSFISIRDDVTESWEACYSPTALYIAPFLLRLWSSTIWNVCTRLS